MLAFAGLVVLSFFFRLRVLNAYHHLVKHQVQFEREHIFNRKKLEEEILPRYPEQRQHILRFTQGIMLSMRIASILIIIISLCAAFLMFGEKLGLAS